MTEHIKIFNVKDGDKDKNNKWISFRIDYETLNIELLGLRVKI